MIKKSLIKDSFREIKKTFSRFLAILAIVTISVAFYTGIKITCPDMKNSADTYYDEYNLMDFRLVSTVGFNETDIEEIRKLPQVLGVSPSYTIDAILDAEGSNSVVRIHSLTKSDKRNGDDYINQPMLVSGKLPEASGECVIEKSGFMSSTLTIGSQITLMSGTEGVKLDSLKTDTFKVVGIIKSPLYVSKDRGTSVIGTGKISSYIMINDFDFDLPVYNTVYLTARGAEVLNTYSDEYDEKIKLDKVETEALAQTRTVIRTSEIKNEADKLMGEKELEYNNAVTEAQTKINDANSTLDINEKKISDGKIALDKEISKFNSTIKTSTAQLDLGDAQLKDGVAQYETKLNEFNLAKEQAIAAGTYESQIEYFTGAQTQLSITKATLDATSKELTSKREQLETAKKVALEQFAIKNTELANAQKEIAKGRADLSASEKEANDKLAAGKVEIDKAKADIAAIPEVKWHVLDRNTNAGYVDYGGAADRMNAIAQVFPLIFILVGILICFTAMGRMVDEQRTFIGAVKALGYSKASIASKYLIYAALASILGGAIGVFIGFSFFPTFIFKAFTALYTLPGLILSFDIPFAIASIGVAVAVTSLSALIVCFEELHISAAQLMRPKAPKPGKVIILERIPFLWNKMKFTQKVTARNLLRYKSRFFMTVIGVAGCTALLLVGFGLQDSISKIGTKQFDGIYNYEMIVGIKDNLTDTELANIGKTIENNPDFEAKSLFMSKNITIGYGDIEKDCGILVPDNKLNLPTFISLHERISRKPLELSETGVILTEKMARETGASVGDEIYIKTSEYDKTMVKITGISENYLNHYLYMTPSLYQSTFKEELSFNSIYVNFKNISTANQETLSGTILSQDGVASVYNSIDMLTRFKDTISSVNYVVLILILSAGLLSFIVLYTLTNINISERMREIATIKVLGFYDREASAYVFKENIILTFIGATLGLVLGYYLSMFVIQTAEVDIIMFGRQIYPLSFAVSFVLTIVFALFVNIVMLKKIRKVNMVEALKTVE